MTVRAVLRDGREVKLAPECGATLDEVVAHATRGGMTGSAVPLASVTLLTDTGDEIAYSDINTFAEDVDFIPGRERR